MKNYKYKLVKENKDIKHVFTYILLNDNNKEVKIEANSIDDANKIVLDKHKGKDPMLSKKDGKEINWDSGPKGRIRKSRNEQEEAPTTDTDGGGGNEKVYYNLVLTPNTVTVDEVIKALENIDNYGAYVSNLRNTGVNVNKAVEDHFGPNQRFTKQKLEKERGKPFPVKTKQAVDDFIKSLKSKPNLLNWKVEGDSIIFPYDKNPTKKVTTNIIDTVLGNANIDYNISEKEVMKEEKLRNMIKEVFKRYNKNKINEEVNDLTQVADLDEYINEAFKNHSQTVDELTYPTLDKNEFIDAVYEILSKI